MADGDERFKSRIAALRERGFDVDLPTGELASEQMLRLEQQADKAAKIRSKVLDLPEHVNGSGGGFSRNLQIPWKRVLLKLS